MGFNFVIMPFFWSMLAPALFTLDWKGMNLVRNVHLITTHSIPFIGGLVNVYITKGFVMLPRDYKAMLFMGMIYIPFNYVGTLNEGHPMYPLADWKNFWETVAWYTALAGLEGFLYYHFAKWICKKRHFNPPE